MKWTGVNVRSTTVSDMFKQNILEPVIIKEQIIKSATEAACMLLRIDDVIASSKSKGGPPGGGKLADHQGDQHQGGAGRREP